MVRIEIIEATQVARSNVLYNDWNKLTLAGVLSQQYDIETVDGVLTVTPAPLAVKVQDVTRPYGEENPQFAAIFDGFVNGDTERVLAAWQEGNKNYYPTLRTYKQVNVISGIGEIGQGSYKLSSRQGVLLISGLQAGDTVSIHDMAGRQVYSGQDDHIRLARGSYVVRIGRWQQKVLVK